MLVSTNPYSQQIIHRFEEDTASAIDQKLNATNIGQINWYKLKLEQRAAYLLQLAAYLITHKVKMAQIASEEMGKPLSQGVTEIEKCAWVLQHYAQEASSMHKNEQIKTEHQKSYVTFEPLGCVLAIMPWNFPYWQVFRVMAPILMAGNSMILKHASNVTACAVAIEDAMKAVNFPPHVFELLKVSGHKMEQIIAHDAIQAITFTGSTAVGTKIAATAGKYLKKQVLELGGSDAYIICQDADLNLAIEKCVQSRLNNTGQSCIGAKRFIVHTSILELFTNKMKTLFENKTMGNPLDNVDIGTIASLTFRNELHQQVMDSKKQGAEIITGGYIPDHIGAFYPPTILTNIQKGMRAYHEEMFGPVASILSFDTIEQAIEIANDTDFGLGGGIFSKNEEAAIQIGAQLLQAGSIAINNCVSSDPRLPFGGIKHSGYGRELGIYGFREFCNIKTITVN